MHQRLLEKFLANLHTLHAAADTALQTQDMSTLYTVAHTLKSAALSVGTLALGQLCTELEKAARVHDTVACQRLGAAFHTAVEQAQSAIRAQTEATGNGP
jgi:HPt (histidine-containing phosphotransfer) domain-containing protein